MSLYAADGWFKQTPYTYHHFPVWAIWLVVFFINGVSVGLAGIIYAATYSTITLQTGTVRNCTP